MTAETTLAVTEIQRIQVTANITVTVVETIVTVRTQRTQRWIQPSNSGDKSYSTDVANTTTTTADTRVTADTTTTDTQVTADATKIQATPRTMRTQQ